MVAFFIMIESNFFEKLIHIVESDIIESYEMEHHYIDVQPTNIVRVASIIKDHSQLKLNQLVDIIAVDYPSQIERFELIYHFLSHENGERLFVKVRLKKDQPIQSITGVFENASWYEREIFDLMGVFFSDHPDLRRLLTEYNFEGHPLRKDFPLSGYTQVYYDEKTKKVEHEAVNLQQSYRNFDNISPWEGVLQKT